MMYGSENWWKSPTTFRGSMDAQMLYKKFILPFNCTSSWRRLYNKYPGLHHLGNWSKLNQAFKPSPLSPSVLHHVRPPGSPVHHLTSPWDLLIDATGFKLLPGMHGEKRWEAQPALLEFAHCAFQDYSQQKSVTLCSLNSPLGMSRETECKVGAWN